MQQDDNVTTETTPQEDVLDQDITFDDASQQASPTPLAYPSPQPQPQPQFTYEQVENLLRLATQRQQTETPQVDPLAEKEKEKAELYVQLQQGDANALVKYMQVSEEVAAFKAQRTAVQAAQQQTAKQMALLNVRQVLDEFRTQEGQTATGFKNYENQWYAMMVQQAQHDPSLFSDLTRAREAGELLLGKMLLQSSRQRKAPPINPQRDTTGKFAPTDKPPVKTEPLPPEAVAAGFTSVEEWKKYSTDGWVPLD